MNKPEPCFFSTAFEKEKHPISKCFAWNKLNTYTHTHTPSPKICHNASLHRRRPLPRCLHFSPPEAAPGVLCQCCFLAGGSRSGTICSGNKADKGRLTITRWQVLNNIYWVLTIELSTFTNHLIQFPAWRAYSLSLSHQGSPEQHYKISINFILHRMKQLVQGHTPECESGFKHRLSSPQAHSSNHWAMSIPWGISEFTLLRD